MKTNKRRIRRRNRKLAKAGIIMMLALLLSISLRTIVTFGAEETEEQKTPPTSIEYTVEAGDSLWSIAEEVVDRFGVVNDTVGNIVARTQAINCIANNETLSQGRTIIVSFYK